MSLLKLELADGWQEVAPRADAPSLLIEEDGQLVYQQSDFETLHTFGPVGPVDCPLAYDASRGLAYRYISQSRYGTQDFSQLRGFNLCQGGTFPVLELSLNQWGLWLLEWIDGREGRPGQLFGLLASDRQSDDRIVIEHNLFALTPGEDRPRKRPICRDGYRPVAFSRARRELVFVGAEGIYLVGLKGERRATFPSEAASSGQGACFDPTGAPRVVLGGDGLFLWDLETNRSERLTRRGRLPIWSADGAGIWYRESSSDLHYLDLASGSAHKVIDVCRQLHPECWFARPVQQSACGRYLALSLTAKQLRGVSRKGNALNTPERVFVNDHAICMLDLERRELWRRTGFANHLCWT